MIDNTAPSLNDEERRDLRRLKEILPASRVIREMTEGWLVGAGLSPTPQGMPLAGNARVVLRIVFGVLTNVGVFVQRW